MSATLGDDSKGTGIKTAAAKNVRRKCPSHYNPQKLNGLAVRGKPLGCLTGTVSQRQDEAHAAAAWRSGKCAQSGTQIVGAAFGEEAFGRRVPAPPQRGGRGQERSSGRRQAQAAAAFVHDVNRHLDEASAFERFEIGGERRAIHGQQTRNASQFRGLWAIERHQQRELAVGQPQRAQDVVEASRERARGTLDVQAEASVADMEGEFIWRIIAL